MEKLLHERMREWANMDAATEKPGYHSNCQVKEWLARLCYLIERGA